MKVLIQSYNTCFQNNAGGIKVRINNFQRSLAAKGIKVDCFNKFRDIITDYDLVHIFKLDCENLALIKLAKSNNIPVVMSTVILCNEGYKILSYRILKKLCPILMTTYRRLIEALELCDVLICESNCEKDFIKKFYGIDNNKIVVIPNGVELQSRDLSEDNNIFSKIGNVYEYVLQVGRFDKNKNQLNVIKAFKNTDIHIVFIGGADKSDQKYFNECKREAEGSHNFHFLGWVEYGSNLLFSAYKNAKVVAMPSYHETFGLTIIEGGFMGANLAISKNLPILEYGIFDHCQKFDPSSPKDIKEKILIELKKNKSSKLKENIITTFSWSSVSNKHIEIYNELVKEK
ncbi:MAG: glycosyltransferase [Candidatus Delongbacteria bacterium]|nr:glycosyltransferase [Candidatus Delongbacteria bacterium]